jgi:hypothetical protein
MGVTLVELESGSCQLAGRILLRMYHSEDLLKGAAAEKAARQFAYLPRWLDWHRIMHSSYLLAILLPGVKPGKDIIQARQFLGRTGRPCGESLKNRKETKRGWR